LKPTTRPWLNKQKCREGEMVELFLYVFGAAGLLFAFGFLMFLLGRMEAAFERHRARGKYCYGRIYQRYPLG
jgi:hypothetical protein